jgi:hypothetical protein
MSVTSAAVGQSAAASTQATANVQNGPSLLTQTNACHSLAEALALGRATLPPERQATATAADCAKRLMAMFHPDANRDVKDSATATRLTAAFELYTTVRDRLRALADHPPANTSAAEWEAQAVALVERELGMFKTAPAAPSMQTGAVRPPPATPTPPCDWHNGAWASRPPPTPPWPEQPAHRAPQRPKKPRSFWAKVADQFREPAKPAAAHAARTVAQFDTSPMRPGQSMRISVGNAVVEQGEVIKISVTPEAVPSSATASSQSAPVIEASVHGRRMTLVCVGAQDGCWTFSGLVTERGPLDLVLGNASAINVRLRVTLVIQPVPPRA